MLNLMQLKKLKELQKRYGYELADPAIAKREIPDRERLLELMALEFSDAVIDRVNEAYVLFEGSTEITELHVLALGDCINRILPKLDPEPRAALGRILNKMISDV